MKIAEGTELTAGQYKISWDMKHLPIGTYLLRIRTSDGATQTAKVMKGTNPFDRTSTTITLTQPVQKTGEYVAVTSIM